MSRKIAFGGIFSAISFIMVYFAGILPSGRLALYAASSFPTAFMLIEFGAASALSVYLVAGSLSYILLGDINAMIPYAIFFGYYSVAKFYIEKVRKPILEILLKLLLFNIILAASYFVYMNLLVADLPLKNISNINIWLAVIIAVLQLAFIVYDYVFTRVIMFYQEKMRFTRW